MADIGKPVRRYKVIPVTDPERRIAPAIPAAPALPTPSAPVPAEPERV